MPTHLNSEEFTKAMNFYITRGMYILLTKGDKYRRVVHITPDTQGTLWAAYEEYLLPHVKNQGNYMQLGWVELSKLSSWTVSQTVPRKIDYGATSKFKNILQP